MGSCHLALVLGPADVDGFGHEHGDAWNYEPLVDDESSVSAHARRPFLRPHDLQLGVWEDWSDFSADGRDYA